MSRSRKYPDELLERGVRLALESGRPVAQVARERTRLIVDPKRGRRWVLAAIVDLSTVCLTVVRCLIADATR